MSIEEFVIGVVEAGVVKSLEESGKESFLS